MSIDCEPGVVPRKQSNSAYNVVSVDTSVSMHLKSLARAVMTKFVAIVNFVSEMPLWWQPLLLYRVFPTITSIAYMQFQRHYDKENKNLP